MKKVLSLLFISCFTFSASAAAIKWGASAAQTASPNGGSLSNYTAYLCVGTTDDAMNMASLIQSKNWVAPSYADPKNLTSAGKIGAGQATLSGLTAGTNYGFYIVTIDESNEYFRVSSVLEEKPFDEKSNDPATTIRWDDVSNLYANNAHLSNTTDGWTKVVPEPTVLALLALGVAGVALRRKKVVA